MFAATGESRALCSVSVCDKRERNLRLRWEHEKPFWFTKRWRARIPKKMLEGVAQTATKRGTIHRLDDDETG